MNEFKNVSELDDWFDGLEVMPDPTRRRTHLLPASIWIVLAIISLTVGAVVAFGT